MIQKSKQGCCLHVPEVPVNTRAGPAKERDKLNKSIYEITRAVGAALAEFQHKPFRN
jgi:hypothetical protein